MPCSVGSPPRLFTSLPVQIEEATIEFNAKISSVQMSETDSSSSWGGSYGQSDSWGGWGYNFNCQWASQRTSQTKGEIKKSYSMNVKVHAVQDEMPAGMAKVLSLLEEAIVIANKPSA